jgi:hypothetical protein
MKNKINNKLNEELNNILSIMGVEKKLIVEQNIFGLVDDMVDAVSTSFRKLFSSRTAVKGTDNIQIGPNLQIPKTELNIYDDIAENGFDITRLKNQYGDAAADKAINKIIFALKEDSNFVDTFYTNYMKSLKNNNEQLRGLVDADITYRMLKFKNENFPNQTTAEFLTSVFGDGITANVMAKKFDDTFKDLDELYRRGAKGLDDPTIKKLYKFYAPKYIQLVETQIANFTKNSKMIEKKIDKELDIIANQIAKEGMSQNIENNLIRIVDNLTMIKDGPMQNAKRLFEDYLIGKKFIQDNADYQKLMKDPNFKRLTEEFSNSSDDVWSKGVGNALKPYADMLFEISYPIFKRGETKLFSPEFWSEVGTAAANQTLKLGKFILTKNPKLSDNLRYAYFLLGKKGYILDKVIAHLVIGTGIIPFIKSYFEVTKVNQDVRKAQTMYIFLKSACDSGQLTDDFCTKIQEFDLVKLKEEDFKTRWKTYVMDSITPYDFDKELSENVLKLTYADDAYTIIKNILYEGAFGEGFDAALDAQLNSLSQGIKEMGWDNSLSEEQNLLNIVGKNFDGTAEDFVTLNPEWMIELPLGSNPEDYDIMTIQKDGKSVYKKKGNLSVLVNKTKRTLELAKEKWEQFITSPLTEEQIKLLNFPPEYFKEADKYGDFRIEKIDDLKQDENGNLIYEGFRLIYTCTNLSETECPNGKIYYVKREDSWYKQLENGEEELVGSFERGSGNSLTSEKAVEIDFIKYLKFFENEYPNVKLIYIDDNTISFDMNNKKYITKKYEDGGPWYWVSEEENGVKTVYDEPRTELVKKDNLVYESTPKKIKTLNESIREKLTSKYIDKTKKMKTLNESIREKLTSKYVNKTNKFLKINENYEKVHKYFEEGDYDNYFNKMFKLAEAFKNSKLYINESDDELFSKGISLLGGQEEMIKEKFVDFLSKDLGLTKSMKDYIEPQIKNMSNTQIGDLFMKPSVVIDIIVDAVVENVKSSASEPTDLMSAIELTTVPYFDSPEFRYKLSKVLKPMIGQKLENKKGKIVDMVRRALKAKEDKSES